MRLEQLQQIIEIERQAFISQAAKALYMAQPTLSNSLGKLEKEIGVKIFERTNEGVVPTTDGRNILSYAKLAVESCRNIAGYTKGQGAIYGNVTVMVTPAFGYLLPDILLRFKERFPKADIFFKTCGPVAMVEALAKSESSVGLALWGIITEQNLKLLKKYDMRCESFGRHQMMLHVSKDHPFAKLSEVEVGMLRDEQFVFFFKEILAGNQFGH